MDANAIKAAFPGYVGWNDPNAIIADYKATGGSGKGGSTGGAGGSGYSPISAPDLAQLRTQVSSAIHPYYQELAKQANGNFDEAVKLMQGDYQSGVKKAKEDYAYAQKYGVGELNNALSTLGLDFNKQNDSFSDNLNQRGAAVYQNNPDGTPNVVQTASFNPTYDANAYTFNPGVSGPNPNTTNLGRGGYEANQLRQNQSLQAEAQMRASMKPLEAAGMSFKQSTNPNGFDPSRPLDYTGDYGQLGSQERSLAGNYQTNKNQLTSTLQGLTGQEAEQTNQLAQSYAGNQIKSLDANAQNSLQKQYQSKFLATGQA